MKAALVSFGLAALANAANVWEASFSQCAPIDTAGVQPTPPVTITATVTTAGPTVTATATKTVDSCATSAPSADTVAVYTDGALAAGWQDWSWDSVIDYAATDLAEGASSISVTSTAWAAVSLKGADLLSNYAGLTFDIAADPSTVQVYFQSSADDTQQTTPVALSSLASGITPDAFTTVTVSFASLDPTQTLDRLNFQATANGATYHLDNIALVKKVTAPLQFTDVYVDDALVSGWEDWSWSSVIDYASTTLAEGKSSLQVVAEAFGALSLKSDTLLNKFSAVQFDVAADPTQVQVYFQSSTDTTESTANILLASVSSAITPSAFTTVKIPFTDFKDTTLDRINVQGLSNTTFVLDNIKLVFDPADPSPTSPPPPETTPIPVTCPTEGRTKFELFGVNESGAEFGSGKVPGVLGTDYTWPTTASVDFFLAKGFNTFRIAFLMERIAPLATGLTGPLDPTYLSGLSTIASYITSNGGFAVLDPHNYMRYNNTIISTDDFAAFWTTLATVFKDDDHIIFDLQNEPHDIPAADVFDRSQAAINAIRATGATKQLILVEGTSWTGAWTWTTSSGNGDVFGAITDPNNNTAIEMHQYLDIDGSGTNGTCVSSTIGSERIASATQWLKDNNLKGFLGEIGGGSNDDCIRAIQGALCDMQLSGGTWLGALWWAAGPWWAAYFMSIEPSNGAAIARILPEALEPFL
ncbi:glycoside hydrolase [Exidia glandulosa HHB12029]|uniref:cellulase n=1 Tax=Exidia glandulosa HHB12029 TaxID=1314781 RepID=A0A165DLK0_EXIGL|nr:glycoside hydrolase [Exidia glandulosa HHB12029]